MYKSINSPYIDEVFPLELLDFCLTTLTIITFLSEVWESLKISTNNNITAHTWSKGLKVAKGDYSQSLENKRDNIS